MVGIGSLGFGLHGKGELVSLGTQSRSNSASSFDWDDIEGYDFLILHFWATTHDGSGEVVGVRMNNDSGANYDFTKLTGTTLATQTGQTGLWIGHNTGSTTHCTGWLSFPTQQVNSACPVNISSSNSNPTALAFTLSGRWNGSADVNRITLYASLGNITGEATLYGVKR